MQKKIFHNKKKCIGCGSCKIICDQLFDMDEKEGKAILKNAEQDQQEIHKTILFPEDKESAESAERACPVNAIRTEK